jgi:hypothetical protein
MKNGSPCLTRTECASGKRYEPASIGGYTKILKIYLKLTAEDTLIYIDPKAHEFKNPKPIPDTEYLDREERSRLQIL